MSEEKYDFQNQNQWFKKLQEQQLKDFQISEDQLNHYSKYQDQPKHYKSHIFSDESKCDTAIKVSPHLQTYNKELKKNRTIPKIQTFKNKLHALGIQYCPQFYAPLGFSLKKIYQSRNKKIMTFQSRFSFFLFKVQVLNLTQRDNLSVNFKNWVNQGVYGTVYAFQIEKKKYAVKKIPLNNNNSQSKTIQQAIKQFSIMKLCGALQIGPAPQNLFGFDIVTTETDVYFTCQMGLSIYDYAKKYLKTTEQLEKYFEILQQKLLLLHSISITHNDIKPNNIIYSQTFQSFSFIDFGLSEANQIILGKMKPQRPKGSINYCCDQMKKLFFDNFSAGLIDLYYNDFVGLQKSRQCFLKTLKFQYTYQAINSMKLEKQDVSADKQNYNSRSYQIESETDQQVSFQTVFYVNEVQKIICIKLMYLIIQKEIKNLKRVLFQNQFAINVMNHHFEKIQLIFFQFEKKKILLKSYALISQFIKQKDEQIFPLTKSIFHSKLQPFFGQQTLQNGSIIHKDLIQSYNKQQLYALQQISQRFEQPLTSLLTINGQYFRTKLVQNKTIIIHSFQDTLSMLILLRQRIQLHGYQVLYQIINFHWINFGYLIVDKDINQSLLNYFQSVFKIMNIQVKFQIQKQHNNQSCSFIVIKFLFYLKIFIVLYFQQIKKYKIRTIIGTLLLMEFHPAQIMDVLISLFYEKKFNVEQGEVLTKQQINWFFVDNSILKFKNFQQLLTIINVFLGFFDSLQFRATHLLNCEQFISAIEQKTSEILTIKCIICFLNEKARYTQNIFASIDFAVQLIIRKLLNFRRRTLSYLFIKYLQIRDFPKMIDTFQKMFFIWQNSTISNVFLKGSQSYIVLKKYLEDIHNEMIQDLGNNYHHQKQSLQLLIYSSFIPFEHYQRYEIIQKYSNYFQKIKFLQTQIEENSFVQYFSLLIVFLMAMEIGDFLTVQQMWKNIQNSKNYAFNEKFMNSYHNYYKKSNNSKKIKYYQRKMKSLNKSEYRYQSDFHNFASKPYSNVVKKITKKQNDLTENISIDSDVGMSNLFDQNQKIIIFQKQAKSILEYSEKQGKSYNFYQESFRIHRIQYLFKVVLYQDIILNKIYCQLIKYYDQMIYKQQFDYKSKMQHLIRKKKIFFDICSFFNQSNNSQQQFWPQLQKQYVIVLRSRLLNQITSQYMRPLQFLNIQFILEEWQKFEKKVHQLYDFSNEKQQPPFIYFDLKFRIKRIIYFQSILNSNRQTHSQYYKSQYQQHCILLFKKLNEKINSNMKCQRKYKLNFEKRIELQKNTIVNDQIFMVILNDCLKDSWKSNLIQNQIKQHPNFGIIFGNQFNPQQECKKIFYNIVITQKIYHFFLIRQAYLILLLNLIQIGSKQLIVSKRDKTRNLFLTFLFYHFMKFSQRHRCTSYTVIIIGIIKGFQTAIRNQTLCNANRKNSYNQLINVVFKLTNFQIELLEQFHQSQEISDVIMALFSCEKLKLDIIKRIFEKSQINNWADNLNELPNQNFLCFSQKKSDQLNNNQVVASFYDNSKKKKRVNDATKQDQNCTINYEIRLKQIRVRICCLIPKLEYLSKALMKHGIFSHLLNFLQIIKYKNHQIITKYLAFSQLTSVLKDKPLNQFESNGWNLYDDQNHKFRRKKRFYEVKLFRNCKRIASNQSNYSQKAVVFSPFESLYYFNFQPYDLKCLQRMIFKGINELDNQDIPAVSKASFQRISQKINRKINKFIEISCK